jgi:hypothetical protein
MSYHPRFDERVSLDGGLYGLGSYFTESTCKANQYTELDGNSERCMVYCRVLMGAEPHRTRATHVGERRPPDNPRTPGATFDSTFAESGVANSEGRYTTSSWCFGAARRTRSSSCGTPPPPH